MHPSFLPVLRCPRTGSPLRLDAVALSPSGRVLEGTLKAEDGGVYPIVRGIPRFVPDEQYSGSFGYEWRRWARLQFEDQNRGGVMEGFTSAMFERATLWPPAELDGNMVLDLGCGPGRFIDLCRKAGARVVGLDMSQAVESARENFGDDPDVLIIQGDALNPPLAPGAFDKAYSIGVLHHTPDPRRGFQSLAASVRPGGQVCCCVYPKGSALYDSPAVTRMRALHRRLQPSLGNGPALAYSYFSAYVLHWLLYVPARIPLLGRLVSWLNRIALPMVNLPDGRWRLLDVFDAITPRFASTHTAEEVRSWFLDSGCTEVRATQWGETAMRGRKG